MKVLAMVALLFLPGNFVAAIFSAPLFDWDGAKSNGSMGVDTKPQFHLFWAITIPLTISIFTAYIGWFLLQRRYRKNVVREFEMTLNKESV